MSVLNGQSPATSVTPVYCYVDCSLDRLGEDAGAMTQCCLCGNWFHKTCLKVQKKSAFIFLWACVPCEQSLPDKLKRLTDLEISHATLLRKFSTLEAECITLKTLVRELASRGASPASYSAVVQSGSTTLPSPPPPPLQQTRPSSLLPSSTTVHLPPAKSQEHPKQTTRQRHPGQGTRSPPLHSRAQQRVSPVLGTGSGVSASTLSSAPPAKRYFISYVDKQVTPQNICTFLSEKGIPAFSFRSVGNPNRAFQSFVFRSSSSRVLDPTVWPTGLFCNLSGVAEESPGVWGSNTDPDISHLTAASRASLYIGGVHLDSSMDNVSAHISQSFAIPPDCFTLQELEGSSTMGFRAFRLDVDRQSESILFNPSLWPQGISVKRFRQAPQNPQGQRSQQTASGSRSPTD